MISRPVLWSIVLGIAGVLIVTWRVTTLPPYIVIINQSGSTLTDVVINTEDRRIEQGTVRNGETRRLSIDPTRTLVFTFPTDADHVWRATEPLTAGQSLVLYVTPGGRVAARSRIGSFAR